MPRPNPPRRRPRRRNPNVVKVPQQVRDQNGDPETPDTPQPAPPPRSARAAVRATAAAPAVLDTSEWSRRSLYVLVALMAVTEIFVSILVFTFSKVSGSLGIYLLGLSPYALLASAFIAMPIAKRITQETRYLRVVETAMVAVFIFFLWYFFLAGAGSILSSTGNVVSNPAVPTPCPSSAAACSTPSPAPSATPSASGGASASASPSSSATATLPVEATATTYTVLGFVDVLPFVLTPLIFYPVYRRFRVRGRPGATPGGRAPPNARKR